MGPSVGVGQCRRAASYRAGIEQNGGHMRRPALRDLIWSLACAVLIIQADPLTAQPFNGCPSEEILAAGMISGLPETAPGCLAQLFARSHGAIHRTLEGIRQRPLRRRVLGVGLGNPDRDGVVLIDTLHEPHVDQLVANLGKVGINLADIKYVLMTHGHFDHVGGAAKLSRS